jgi:DNA-nicking Smr family endonuclease
MNDAEPFRIPVTSVLDLHSVPPRDVKPVVEEYLLEARRLGLKALRIVHGRGMAHSARWCAGCSPAPLL